VTQTAQKSQNFLLIFLPIALFVALGADTGPGIPADALSRIFEPYWQVQKTRSGMGLGLFIAKTLVDAHRGRMWVDSSVGRGTTFYFTLPAVRIAE
jgi:signal transduction histidine kinase